MGFSPTIDVPDIGAALAFYGGVFGFAEVARPVPVYAVLDMGGQTLGLIEKSAGTLATPVAGTERHYDRHWTPIHLDFHVDDFETAHKAVLDLGGTVEALHRVPGRSVVAFCCDPFGHGFCLLGPKTPADPT